MAYDSMKELLRKPTARAPEATSSRSSKKNRGQYTKSSRGVPGMNKQSSHEMGKRFGAPKSGKGDRW